MRRVRRTTNMSPVQYLLQRLFLERVRTTPGVVILCCHVVVVVRWTRNAKSGVKVHFIFGMEGAPRQLRPGQGRAEEGGVPLRWSESPLGAGSGDERLSECAPSG